MLLLIGNPVCRCRAQVYGTAGTAVRIRGGQHESLARGGHVVQNNWIHHYARWFRTYNPGIHWAGVGNLFARNHIGFAPHQAFLGGGNEAVCAAAPGEAAALGHMCGGNDNVFEFNHIEHVCSETDDSGAFYSCGQGGTAYINRGNIVRGNVFEHVRMVDAIHLGNPVVQGVYLDDGMTGWLVANNTFIDCQNGVLLNGGRGNVVANNSFREVDYAVYMGDECQSDLAYGKLVNASRWPAWAKYGMEVPPTVAAYQNYTCLAGGNVFENNTYCTVPGGAFCRCTARSTNASRFRGNVQEC